MSDATISAQRGTTIGFLLPVELPDETPVDVTLAGTVVTVSFKRLRTDAAVLFSKTWTASNPGGSTMHMKVGSTNTLDVEITPGDTAAFAKTEFLVWDAILTEPSGRVTPIAKGALTVRLGVGS